jgi:hypothetical protein
VFWDLSILFFFFLFHFQVSFFDSCYCSVYRTLLLQNYKWARI